jgi:hypothetical protein
MLATCFDAIYTRQARHEQVLMTIVFRKNDLWYRQPAGKPSQTIGFGSQPVFVGYRARLKKEGATVCPQPKNRCSRLANVDGVRSGSFDERADCWRDIHVSRSIE